MTPPLPLEEAQARLLDQVQPLPPETLGVVAALGRWLTAPVIARRTQPWADLSSMDGYATSGEGPWTIVGESAAGVPFANAIRNSEAVKISTGAALPVGTDAIVILEDASVEGNRLVAGAKSASAAYIRREGFDFRRGDCLLDRGERVGAARLALAVSGGIEAVEVGRIPSVAIIDTGDELKRGPADDRPDALPASNGAMLAALLSPFASSIARIGPVADDIGKLAAAFPSVEASDVVITTGGASVGEHDLVRPALEACGARIEYWRVAIKPGKPLLVARRDRQWIVGLPGNPASAYVTAILFVLPLLRRLASAPTDVAVPVFEPASLVSNLPAGGPRREFVRGILKAGRVQPIDERDSSALLALASANCLIGRAALAAPATAGDQVSIIRLPET